MYPLFEVSFRFAYAYSIANSELRRADALVTIQYVATRFPDWYWVTSDGAHTDTAVIGAVVRSHKCLQDVDVSNRLGFREITPHTCLQCPIEPLDNARLRFFVVRRKMMHTMPLLATSVTIGSKIRVPLSVCNVFGAPLLSNCVKAATNEAAELVL